MIGGRDRDKRTQPAQGHGGLGRDRLSQRDRSLRRGIVVGAVAIAMLAVMPVQAAEAARPYWTRSEARWVSWATGLKFIR